jgi:hypothetical protein
MDETPPFVFRVKSKMTILNNMEEPDMKKRVLAGVLVTVLALSVGTTSAFAAGPGAGQGRNFVDEDRLIFN